ncbi:SDR family NAD(P)-dependent oxidoreductase [Mitsuokella sp. oral taxon 131]|uniref:SDR family NAD(P)-dependent oxidoreductase n=1 Tax=Mitsuokella sp. oral taxon 131 TaxID=1321780 RepID=UPI0003AE28E0|nr:SDR family oxidoreductase [Mitsuokella sp. oral taxon 131]ERL04628.1 putative 2-(S)-hydroxypropyl-CoM dehydrogenase [Mitsuokella sp. oral taxon 131 str. W9106]
MDLELAGKVALISGGTSGIGLASAAAFLAEGACVALMARDTGHGEDAVRGLRAAHGAPEDVVFCAGNVAQKDDCARVVQEVQSYFGHIDVLVNAAGIYAEGALEALHEEELDAVLATNVKGTMLLSQAALPRIKEVRGNIVNVASDAGLHGNYFAAAYCASKGAVVLFTRALALEVASAGVRVNAIAPGDVMTPMTQAQLDAAPDPVQALREMAGVYPLGRIATADEAAALIVYLASARAAFMTGTICPLDGGLTA